MKKLIIILTILCSCGQPEYIDGKRAGLSPTVIRYFRDNRTGVCFAECGAGNSYSMTCVPCDSVKNLIQK